MIYINQDGELIEQIAQVNSSAMVLTYYGIITGVVESIREDVCFFFDSEYNEIQVNE